MEKYENYNLKENNNEDEIIEKVVNSCQKKEDSNRTKNSQMMFAILIDDPNSKGEKIKAKCILCNKVLLRKRFLKHIDDVHTSHAKGGGPPPPSKKWIKYFLFIWYCNIGSKKCFYAKNLIPEVSSF